MSLDDLAKAKDLAATRETIIRHLNLSDGDASARFFGIPLDGELLAAIRGALQATLRERLVAIEADLRDLGVVMPAPIEPRSWDPLAGVFASSPAQQ